MFINNKFGSPNYDTRVLPVEYIIVHFTEMLFKDALAKLTDAKSAVSAHYLIKDDGTIFQLVSIDKIAWHAGKSHWHGHEKLNQNSIGIELDNLGCDPFNREQMQACIDLSKCLMQQYNIPNQNFIGHSDVAPDRKVDPGVYFNWQLCAENGLGIWHDYEPQMPKVLYQFGEQGDDIRELQLKLRAIGYNAASTGTFDLQTNYVIRAFQLKFHPQAILAQGYQGHMAYDDLAARYNWDFESEQMLNILLKIVEK